MFIRNRKQSLITMCLTNKEVWLYVGYEVLTLVILKSSIFWDMDPVVH
jgi:hypothetical protein